MSLRDENRQLRAMLQTVRDALKYTANSEGGMVARIDPLLGIKPPPTEKELWQRLEALEAVADAATALVWEIPDRPWPGRAGPKVAALREALGDLGLTRRSRR